MLKKSLSSSWLPSWDTVKQGLLRGCAFFEKYCIIPPLKWCPFPLMVSNRQTIHSCYLAIWITLRQLNLCQCKWWSSLTAAQGEWWQPFPSLLFLPASGNGSSESDNGIQDWQSTANTIISLLLMEAELTFQALGSDLSAQDSCRNNISPLSHGWDNVDNLNFSLSEQLNAFGLITVSKRPASCCNYLF